MRNETNRASAKKWTQSAVECYSIGCNCPKCYIYSLIGRRCRMKETVLELVRQFGKPKGENSARR